MGELKATVFKQGDTMFADVLPKPSPDIPDAWVLYVEVADAEATIDLAVKSGGSVIAPAMPLPSIGIVAWLADPTGAVFCILQPEEPAAQ